MTRLINTTKSDTNELQELIRKCVHCGFCNATCPSYQQLNNELDGPRGRIYQISNMIDGTSDATSLRHHLDTCLNCRNCETACPSGVEYGKIFSLGKKLAVKKYPYSKSMTVVQSLLVHSLGNPIFCKIVFTVASLFRPLLPPSMKRAVPKHEKHMPLIDSQNVTKKVLLLQGCVQSGAQENTNRALHNLCARLGIELIAIKPASCCGALAHHLNHEQQAIEKAKANINACYPYIEMGVEAIAMAASACVLELQEYPQLLKHEQDYIAKADQFSNLVKDPSQLLIEHGLEDLGLDAKQATIAFHPPCTLQHGQGKSSQVDNLLQKLGFQLQPIAKKNLCCGSAGTYSIFQRQIAKQLRDEKVIHLMANKPQYLATANIGCQLFLQQATNQKIWHWLELIERQANRANVLY